MNILALDTSTKNFSLAVLKGGEPAASHDIVLDKVLSDSIIPSIDTILKKAKLPFAQLDGFVVGLGPGSFTSLRVGLSTIKGFSFATQKPLIGVASLDAIAMNVNAASSQDVCVITDAKRSMVYAAFYTKTGPGLKRKSKYLLLEPKDLFSYITRETIVVGDGVALYRPLFEHHFARGPVKVLFENENRWLPKAEHLALLARVRFEQKKFDDSRKILPLYLYPQDCQVKR